MLIINKVKIPQYLWKKIVKYYEDAYSGVIPESYSMSDFAKHRVESSKVQLERIGHLRIGKKNVCLDAGCGIGTFVAAANLAGYDYYGYEIDPIAAEIARQLLKVNNISPRKIRDNPKFKGLRFDFVSSFEVVEHVADLPGYFGDVGRVIKPKGKFFMETPNYLIPYEPHFYIFFPPGPTIWKWWCCQLAGRTNRKFFNELRFVTPIIVESALRKEGFEIENLGIVEWTNLLTGKEIQGRSMYVVWLSMFLRATRLGALAKWLASKGLYTPMVYIARPG